ncbi:hypothetical protein ACWPKO_29030 (plasmid) [Coraliomargarita sp. W4R53]
MMKPTGQEVVAWVVAGVLVLAGAITLIVGLSSPPTASFGWFAYQPLSGATIGMTNPGSLLPPAVMAGAALCALGLIMLAFLAGWRLAFRAAARAVR